MFIILRIVFFLVKAVFGIEGINKILLLSYPFLNPRILRWFGASVGGKNVIWSPLIMMNAASGYANLKTGDSCHTGKNVLIDLSEPVVFGDRVTVSMGVSIITHFDPGESRLKERGYPRTTGKVILENDAYIGAHAIVLPGITVGEGSLVGAGSVVTRDIPPYSLAVGVPARIIRKIPGTRNKKGKKR